MDKLGLKQNWRQFTLLVVVNAFVGGMVGLERTILPEFAAQEFEVNTHSAVLSFIVAFGLVKAFTNYFTGRLANRVGRKNLLVIGWLFALPIPIILMYAPNWSWVIMANVLLGINQGLTWSSTVVMKIDLVGDKDRGLAMGINEFAGYFAVGVVAFITGWIAQEYGVVPYPFYLGVIIALLGLGLSFFFIEDTRKFVEKEEIQSDSGKMDNVFIETSFKNKALSAISQAGLVNNLNDGMIWGLLPVLLLSLQFDTVSIGVIAGVYPTVWGICQLGTGKLGDLYSKKKLLFWGMLLQGVAICVLALHLTFYEFVTISALLGIGTALVYPNFLSAIADATKPSQRAESIGVFRLWRDLGYAVGAITSGIIADIFGVQWAIVVIGFITILSALVIQFRMPENKL